MEGTLFRKKNYLPNADKYPVGGHPRPVLVREEQRLHHLCAGADRGGLQGAQRLRVTDETRQGLYQIILDICKERRIVALSMADPIGHPAAPPPTKNQISFNFIGFSEK